MESKDEARECAAVRVRNVQGRFWGTSRIGKKIGFDFGGNLNAESRILFSSGAAVEV